MAKQNSRKITNTGCCGLPIIIAGLVILLQEGDCDKPIRTWLYGVVISYGILFVLSVLESVAGFATKFWGFSATVLSLTGLFQLAWYITGSVWLFSDNECSHRWESGYVLSLVLLIFFYVTIGLVVLILCCVLCCAGVLLGAAAGAAVEEAKENEKHHHHHHEETKE